jgi:hypothetical protein
MKTSDWLSNINERDICEERALCSATHSPPRWHLSNIHLVIILWRFGMFSHGSYCSLWRGARSLIGSMCRADKSDSCEPIPGPGSSANCPLKGVGGVLTATPGRLQFVISRCNNLLPLYMISQSNNRYSYN